MKTVRAIDERLKAAPYRKFDAVERWKKIKIDSEVGEILIVQFEQGDKAGLCRVCGNLALDSLYMLNDDVWAEAGLEPHDVAHAVCVSKRLGRSLTPGDFSDAPCNDIAASMTPR